MRACIVVYMYIKINKCKMLIYIIESNKYYKQYFFPLIKKTINFLLQPKLTTNI